MAHVIKSLWFDQFCDLLDFGFAERLLWRGPDDSLLYHHAANWTLGVDLPRSV